MQSFHGVRLMAPASAIPISEAGSLRDKIDISCVPATLAFGMAR
jgi:hypothetical protein